MKKKLPIILAAGCATLLILFLGLIALLYVFRADIITAGIEQDAPKKDTEQFAYAENAEDAKKDAEDAANRLVGQLFGSFFSAQAGDTTEITFSEEDFAALQVTVDEADTSGATSISDSIIINEDLLGLVGYDIQKGKIRVQYSLDYLANYNSYNPGDQIENEFTCSAITDLGLELKDIDAYPIFEYELSEDGQDLVFTGGEYGTVLEELCGTELDQISEDITDSPTEIAGEEEGTEEDSTEISIELGEGELVIIYTFNEAPFGGFDSGLGLE